MAKASKLDRKVSAQDLSSGKKAPHLVESFHCQVVPVAMSSQRLHMSCWILRETSLDLLGKRCLENVETIIPNGAFMVIYHGSRVKNQLQQIQASLSYVKNLDFLIEGSPKVATLDGEEISKGCTQLSIPLIYRFRFECSYLGPLLSRVISLVKPKYVRQFIRVN